MALSRKDYVKVAAILNERRRVSVMTVDLIAEDLADYFRSDNERFDRGRFLAAVKGKVAA